MFYSKRKVRLKFAQEASMIPVNVSEITENSRNYWSDDDIVEIMGVIALFGYLNRWNDVMATSLEDEELGARFTKGDLVEYWEAHLTG